MLWPKIAYGTFLCIGKQGVKAALGCSSSSSSYSSVAAFRAWSITINDMLIAEIDAKLAAPQASGSVQQ